MHNWDTVGKGRAAGRQSVARPYTVGPGCLFALLWRGTVDQDELRPFRTNLELSFFMGTDRPSCT